MKTLTLILLAFVLLPAASATGQSVRAQLVHNSPDPAVAVIDVYVDSVLTIDDFAFQTATPYMDLPAGTHNLSLAPSSSSGAGEALVSVAVDLVEGKTYSIIAAGVLDPTQFGPNPAGRSTALTLFTTDDALEAAPTPTEVRWRAFLGVTDLPAINFRAGATGVFNNLAYGDFSDHEGPSPGISIGTASRAGPGTLISSNTRDFAPSVGQALLGMPTGFWGGPERIQWMAVAPDGTVDFGTDSTPLSRAQIVHNSADPAAALIDVWLDGGLYLNDFAFQTATPYLDLPVGSHEVVIADSSSVSLADAVIASLRFTMARDSTHSIVFAGVLDPEAFNPNPDGRDISLGLFVAAGARESSPDASEFTDRQFYGITDLPASNFTEGTSNVIFSNVAYGEFTDYVSAPPGVYTGLHGIAGNGTSHLVQLKGDFTNRAGQSILEMPSGFFAGEDGLGIGWMQVLPDGTVVESENETETYRAQIVHASPDPLVDVVDVYLDGGLLVGDLAFKEATKFVTLPQGTHEISFVDPASTGKDDAVMVYRDFFFADKTHSLVLAGVVDTTQWPVNPTGRDVSLNLFIADDALEVSPKAGEYAIRQFYGVTNMPLVDFWVDTWGTVPFESMGYGDFTQIEDDGTVGPLVGSIRAAGSGRNDPLIHSGEQDWGNFRGSSILEVYTGLMREHGLVQFYVTPDGEVGQSDVRTSVDAEDIDLEIPSEFAIHGNYPNPFNPATSITFDLPDAASVSVQVFDATGRMVMQTRDASFSAGADHAVQVNATAWGSGLYLYKVVARARTSSWTGTGRMMLVK